MTKDLLNSLQTLIDGFNAKNVKHDVFYQYEVDEYHNNSYSFTIYYRIFFGSDLAELMSFCLKNELHCLSGCIDETCAYIDFQ